MPLASMRGRSRRALAAVATAALAAGLLAVPLVAATPAAAETPPVASTETLLDGVTAASDVATGGGKVFVAATDRVVVADGSGAVIDSIGGLPGATGLATSADGNRLYVALRDSGEVAVVDTATLGELRRIVIGHPCPQRLALDGTRLVVGYGCGYEWNGGVVALDTAAATPDVVEVWAGTYGAPVITAAGGLVVAGEAGLSPAQFNVYEVSGTTATLRGTLPPNWGDASNLQDLALTPDGGTVISAAGYPYVHVAYDTTTLTESRRYGEGLGYYPNAVTVSRDGAYVALGRQASRVLSVHRVSDGGLLSEADPTSGDLVAGTLAFAGEDVFGLLNDWSNQRYYLWRVPGATLPTSAVSLTGPATTRALDPLSLTGRLTLSDGADPGVQTLTVTRRRMSDGTSATLPAVTTDAAGSFSIVDRPPDAGAIEYTASWAGGGGYRGSSGSVTVQVESRTATLTLTGPATSEAGKRIRLSGSLSLDGSPPSPAATLEVYRSISNNRHSTTDRLADVTTDNQGGFRFSDTPTEGGQIVYTVRWTGTTGYAEASASHEVSVSSTAAMVTALIDQPAYAIEPYWVAGGITYEVGTCTGLKTVQVTRQVGDGQVEQRPALTTDVSCGFRFQDVLPTPSGVRYTFSWAGDATHKAASVAVSGTVQQQPSYVQATAQDYYLTSNQRVAISGVVAGSRTGPVGTALTLTVTRTGPDGSTVRLRDVTTATDGTFTLRDSLPKVDPSLFPPFTYEISWAGNTVYAGSSASVTVYVTPTG